MGGVEREGGEVCGGREGGMLWLWCVWVESEGNRVCCVCVCVCGGGGGGGEVVYLI